MTTEVDPGDSLSPRCDDKDLDAAELSTDYDDDDEEDGNVVMFDCSDLDTASATNGDSTAAAEDTELESNAATDLTSMQVSNQSNVATSIAAAEQALAACGISAEDVASLPSAAWMGRNFLHAATNGQLICDHPSVFVQYPLRDASAAVNASSSSSSSSGLASVKPGSSLVDEQRKGEWAVAALKLCLRALPPAWLTNDGRPQISSASSSSSSSTSLSSGTDSAPFHLPEDVHHSGKLTALLTLIAATQRAGERIVVFSRWTLTLDLVARALRARGIVYRRIDGATTSEERAAIVDEFKPGGEGSHASSSAAGAAHVVLVSTKCGAEGINLAAANRVALTGVSWNPNDDMQVRRNLCLEEIGTLIDFCCTFYAIL